MSMDIILIPGLWLDGSSWEKVVPVLAQVGHRTHPLTLPGMESQDADRSGITLRDHADAVIAAIDAVDPAGGKVVLVGHSAGGAIAHAAVDARPDRVARVVYVGGFPTGDGAAVADGYPAENGEVPLPDWSAFEDEELADLDDTARAAFRARAIPSPAHVTRDPQQLTDERRYDVPVTVIATEFTSAMLRTWIARGEHPVREFTKIRDVDYVDLPTGHWPQFTRPEDLGRAILGSTVAPPVDAPPMTSVDEQGSPDPPVAGDETATLLGALERNRATLAWKCGGLDAAGLRATVGASSMTLGGLLKHLAYVEDDWFSRWLHGRDKAPPWDTVDWDADPDWDWRSAAEDSPEHLYALWQEAVARSRSLVAEALAGGGLDQLARRTWPDGRAPSLRRLLIDMIEEYARHTGHADLLREAVDGLVGEGSPDVHPPYQPPASPAIPAPGVIRPGMTARISPRQFHAAVGVEDWRVLFGGACAHFRTGSFAAGVALVDAIGRLADAGRHDPAVDLRYDGVTVRLRTHDIDGLSERDVELARKISAAARALDVPADPTAVQTVQVAIDALVGPAVRPFWRAVLGYQDVGDEDLVDPHGRGPSFWFQPMDAPRPQRNRIHVDISVPHDQAEARIAAALAAGGHLVTDRYAPAWWTLADAEGNEVDVATWMGRD